MGNNYRTEYDCTFRGNKFLKVQLLLLFCFIGIAGAKAQDTTSADGLFEYARKTAYEQKDYANAIRLAQKVLAINSHYTDVVIFIGRVYTWSKNTDSARYYLKSALDIDPKNEDGYLAFSDLDYWNKNNAGALATIGLGLTVFPKSEELLIRKVKVLMALHRYREALPVTDTLLQMKSSNAEARELNVILKDLSAKNKLTISGEYAHFDKQFPSDWRFASLEYVNETKVGPVVARINYANRFNTDGYQFEMDAYPHLSRMFYLYLNAGYSDQTVVFPEWRGAASLFANLPHAYEAEAGMRYLYYTSDIYFYMAYLGKYYKKFFVGLREYVTPSPSTYTNTTGLFVRYYYGGSDDYIHFDVTRGILVDQRWYNLSTYDRTQLPSYFGELIFQKSIKKLNLVSVNVSIYQQQYLPGVIGNQYQAGISYARRF